MEFPASSPSGDEGNRLLRLPEEKRRRSGCSHRHVREKMIQVRKCPPLSDLHKPALRRAAPGAFPGVGQVLKRSSRLDAVVGVANCREVDVAAEAASV